MTLVAESDGTTLATPRLSTERLRLLLLWLMGFAGAFVFIEPSPYEIAGSAAIVVFLLTGLQLRASLGPIVFLLVLLNLGYAAALLQVIDDPKAVAWVGISAFLALTTILYAAVIGDNTQRRLRWLLGGYMAAAVVAAAAGIVGYFQLSGTLSDLFLRYGRVRGTFNDPNVLGAFLVLPALILLQRIIAGRLRQVVIGSALLVLLLAALLLTFSRGAWGQFGFCAIALLAVTFASSPSPKERMRIAGLALASAIILVGFIAALLSIEQVAEQFKERASFEQSYDLGHLGRFGRYLLGAALALDHPFGIGPLQFAKTYFPEDPHNTFLNEFMSGGWLSGFVYLTMTLMTILAGLRFLFVATPWRPFYQAIYIAYVGVIGEAAIIDIDHWRHYYLLLGALWGLIAASRSWVREMMLDAASARSGVA